MKPSWNPLRTMTSDHWKRSLRKNALWLAGGGASLAVILISCASTGRTLMAPPSIPGAEFVGSEECATCHEDTVRDFKTADHAKLQAKGSNVVNVGCESCHGPGSKHVEAGGGAGTIVNPNKDSDTCFQCHLDKKAQFMLPNAHPVLNGKMNCSDCHDPHASSGTQLERLSDACLKCHTQQAGPFAFEHEATRDGCTVCHNPHGSVNDKMLTERNASLCLKCHTQGDTGIGASGSHATASRLGAGTCWSVGCHEGVHGSNTSPGLRY